MEQGPHGLLLRRSEISHLRSEGRRRERREPLPQAAIPDDKSRSRRRLGRQDRRRDHAPEVPHRLREGLQGEARRITHRAAVKEPRRLGHLRFAAVGKSAATTKITAGSGPPAWLWPIWLWLRQPVWPFPQH